jgi:ribonuclease R
MELSKENILDLIRRAPPHGWKIADLLLELSLDGKGKHRLRRLIEELQEAGDIERVPGARYRIPQPEGAPPPKAIVVAAPAPLVAQTDGLPGVVGRIRVHPAGYGFVERTDDSAEPDVFVPARFRGTALDGDKVRLTTWMGHKGTEGRVEQVLERGRAKLTGLVRVVGRRTYLEPDDPRIASTYGQVTLEEGTRGARHGQCVVAEITKYPTTAEGGELVAKIAHVLGDPDDPRTEVAKVVACAEIPDEFPEDALTAAKRVSQELSKEDFADRIDLRDRAFLTIDPETARDFDDAVFLESRPSGHRLWVAVADVSHYVRPGNAIDREARIRSCSVYLPDRAIPMLPKELSAGICSLLPEVDRCAMVVRMDVANDGTITDKAFCAAVIRSHARLDYPGVASALAGDFRGTRARYQQWEEPLKRMHALSRLMRAKRRERGALDFDLPEAKVILDEDNPLLVRDVRRSKSSPEVKQAYQLVEECMLAANEAVAAFFTERGLDSVWRVHDKPSLERLEEFSSLAEGFGVEFDAEQGQDPRVVSGILRDIAGKPYEKALNFLLLRSLKQATYDVVNIGHFGLASKEYLHFTSPIRRYPDLIVHRLLKYHLRREGEASGGSNHATPPPKETLQLMATESSAHERRAAEAEREVVDMYRAFLMRERVGEELDGIISGVTSFGVFVECLEPYVEGLIKLDALGGDSYQFDDRQMKLRGRRNGRMFSLGDPVKVRVENVSVARRRIDLALLDGGTASDWDSATTVAKDGADRRQKRTGAWGGPKGGGKKPTPKPSKPRSGVGSGRLRTSGSKPKAGGGKRPGPPRGRRSR